MKLKISVFMLLLSFLVGLVAPGSARAEDTGYAFNEWCEDNGLVCGKASDEDWSSVDKHFTYDSGCIYIVNQGGSDFYLTKVMSSVDDIGLYFYSNNKIYAKSLSSSKAFSKYVYKYSIDGWHFLSSASPSLSTSQFTSFITDVSQSSVVYTNVSLYSDDSLSGVPLVSVTEKPYVPYLFNDWCSDAGLNCAASSNETEELYHFTFNPEDYHYIVRRNRIAGSKYTLFLSQLTKEEDLIYYSTNRALADSKIGAAALYVLSGEYASGSTNICNYVYDSSGGGWLYTDNFGVDLGLTNDYFVDDIGISFSSSIPIVYSSMDIYSDKEQSSVYYVADTEFKDPFVLYPIISPTPSPTPTTAPGSGSGSSGGGRPGSGTRPDTGGQASGGGGLDFIINLFTMIWTKICSVPMAVDGYSISLQQIIVYGALVSIVGGFIMHFIFGRK